MHSQMTALGVGQHDGRLVEPVEVEDRHAVGPSPSTQATSGPMRHTALIGDASRARRCGRPAGGPGGRSAAGAAGRGRDPRRPGAASGCSLRISASVSTSACQSRPGSRRSGVSRSSTTQPTLLTPVDAVRIRHSVVSCSVAGTSRPQPVEEGAERLRRPGSPHEVGEVGPAGVVQLRFEGAHEEVELLPGGVGPAVAQPVQRRHDAVRQHVGAGNVPVRDRHRRSTLPQRLEHVLRLRQEAGEAVVHVELAAPGRISQRRRVQRKHPGGRRLDGDPPASASSASSRRWQSRGSTRTSTSTDVCRARSLAA